MNAQLLDEQKEILTVPDLLGALHGEEDFKTILKLISDLEKKYIFDEKATIAIRTIQTSAQGLVEPLHPQEV